MDGSFPDPSGSILRWWTRVLGELKEEALDEVPPHRQQVEKVFEVQGEEPGEVQDGTEQCEGTVDEVDGRRCPSSVPVYPGVTTGLGGTVHRDPGYRRSYYL